MPTEPQHATVEQPTRTERAEPPRAAEPCWQFRVFRPRSAAAAPPIFAQPIRLPVYADPARPSHYSPAVGSSIAALTLANPVMRALRGGGGSLECGWWAGGFGKRNVGARVEGALTVGRRALHGEC
jgi:hypothetical protein